MTDTKDTRRTFPDVPQYITRSPHRWLLGIKTITTWGNLYSSSYDSSDSVETAVSHDTLRLSVRITTRYIIMIMCPVVILHRKAGWPQ